MAEGWHVETSVPSIVLTAGGQTVEVVRVSFATEKGSRGHVDIPFAEFTAARARELVEPAAQHLLDVENL